MEYETITTTECRCEDCVAWEDNGECVWWGKDYVHDPNDCKNVTVDLGDHQQEIRHCAERQATYVVKNTKPADGIVLAESASRYPDGKGGFAYAEEMKGSNHQQMRNDNNTKLKLLSVFSGANEGYFFTKPK